MIFLGSVFGERGSEGFTAVCAVVGLYVQCGVCMCFVCVCFCVCVSVFFVCMGMCVYFNCFECGFVCKCVFVSVL